MSVLLNFCKVYKCINTKTCLHLQCSLTSNGDIGCGLGISVDAAVKSAVLQLCVFDGQLHDAGSIFYLVLEIILQQLLTLPPLHSKAGFRQLAAQ